MIKRQTHGKEGRLADYSDGRDENNLAEFPLALLTDRIPPGTKCLEFEDSLHDWSTGQIITRRVCISGSDKFGLPRPKDEDILLALIQLTRLATNFASPEVWFTKHQVIELLGWDNRGWAYDRIEESLHRWKGVSLHYWNAWRDNKRGTWRDTMAVGVIEYFAITDSRKQKHRSGHAGLSRFVWSKMFFESFQAGYLKPLDFGTYRLLVRPAARRAYRFLDKRFHHRPEWEFELRHFACEKLGFSRSYDTGQLKERLRPALDELEQVGFIEPVTFCKRRSKEWTIAVVKKRPSVQVEETKQSDTSLASELEKRGIEHGMARVLVDDLPSERIRAKMAVYDWLKQRSDPRVSKNGPGFLVSAIRKDYPLPKDFLRSARSAAKVQVRSGGVNEPRKRAQNRHASPEISAEEQRLQAFQDGLSAAQRSVLLNNAVTEATRLEQESLQRLKIKGGELLGVMEASLVRKHILRHGLHVGK